MHPARRPIILIPMATPRAPRPFTAPPPIPLTSAVAGDAPRQRTARDLLRALEEDLAMQGPIERGVRRVVARRDFKPANQIINVPRFERRRY